MTVDTFIFIILNVKINNDFPIPMNETGRYLVVIVGIIIVLGLLIWGLGNRFSWFGHLPGDIRIERETFRLYIPLTSMLLLTILLNLIIWVIRKFFL
jgi:hypothetical protein